MCSFRLLTATLAAVLVWPAPAKAGLMLTGNVTYNSVTRLYTYSYTLDDRAALAPIDQIYIRVFTGYGYGETSISPVSHAGPAPFADFATYGGDGQDGFLGGTFFGWNASEVWATLTPGVRRGFSFATPYGPASDTANNYSLFSTASTYPPHNLRDGELQYGRVVAPDFGRALTTPEPASLLLVTVGTACVGLRAGWRRSRGRPTAKQHPYPSDAATV
jgi:hypothetical protein